MSKLRLRFAAGVLSFAVLTSLPGFQPATPTSSRLADPFAAGWMLVDTNGDGVIDLIAGKIVVPARSSAVENAAAANLAARLGNGTTGLTPPIVITATEDRADGPRIWVGAKAVPSRYVSRVSELTEGLAAEEGGVFLVDGNLAVAAKDDSGLQAAAEALSAHVPYLWKVPGERLTALADAVAQAAGRPALMTGLSYLKGKAGIHRAFLRTDGALTNALLDPVLALPEMANVHELVVTAGATRITSTSAKALGAIPPAPSPAAAAAAGAAGAAGAEATAPPGLDLAKLYTMRGLFRGTPRMPIPSALDSQIYVPAGAPGVAMANLAARMGMESTGITLPFAYASPDVTPKEVRTKSIVVESTDLGKEAARQLKLDPLPPGDGELRVVEKAFGRQSTVLVRGDEAGSSAALALLSDHLPNVWEPGKRYLSIEEIRFDLHRFFSLRSAPGQAGVALYRLDKWMDEIRKSGETVHDVEAKLFVEVADPGLAELARAQIQKHLGVSHAKVTTGSLRAGTQCCEKTPSLHYHEPGYTFKQAQPSFAEDIVIPWEGTRLIQAVKAALPKVKPGTPARLVARVSEGPEQRKKLEKELAAMLALAGAKAPQVSMICSYKSGYSWLMDDIAPQLQGKAVASMKIEFKKNEDPTHMRSMFSPARWVHELYPVDEDLARTLKIPLAKVELAMFEGDAKSPTYRVHAYDAGGREILAKEFTVTTVMQPYNGIMKSYEQVEVSTGWVHIESGSATVLDQRIKTDIEEFWDHYQNQTLPRVYASILSQAQGEIRPEYAPAFDTLRIDIHMSEPDYDLGIDKERISSLEALQEETFTRPKISST